MPFVTLIVDVVLQGSRPGTLGKIEDGTFCGFTKDVLCRGLRHLLFNQVVDHLLFKNRIDDNTFILQLCLDHLNIVIHSLAVPLSDVIKPFTICIHGSHAAIRTCCASHQRTQRPAVPLILISLFTLKVITDFVHDGNDCGSENISIVCHNSYTTVC